MLDTSNSSPVQRACVWKVTRSCRSTEARWVPREFSKVTTSAPNLPISQDLPRYVCCPRSKSTHLYDWLPSRWMWGFRLKLSRSHRGTCSTRQQRLVDRAATVEMDRCTLLNHFRTGVGSRYYWQCEWRPHPTSRVRVKLIYKPWST